MSNAINGHQDGETRLIGPLLEEAATVADRLVPLAGHRVMETETVMMTQTGVDHKVKIPVGQRVRSSKQS